MKIQKTPHVSVAHQAPRTKPSKKSTVTPRAKGYSATDGMGGGHEQVATDRRSALPAKSLALGRITGVAVKHELSGHKSMVGCVASSRDGKLVASGSDDGTVRVWDAKSGKCILGPLEGHTSGVRCVAFSPDDKRVVAGGDGAGNVRVWDAKSGECLLTLAENLGFVTCVAISPDGKLVASASSAQLGTVRIWDAKSGKCLCVLDHLDGHRRVDSLAFSPDSKRIVSRSPYTVRVWDARSGECLLGPLETVSTQPGSVDYSPDGKQIVWCSFVWDNDREALRVWDAESGDSLLEFKLERGSGFSHSVALSPDQKQVATGSRDGIVRIVDAETGCPCEPVRLAHGSEIKSISFSRDGKYIFSGQEDGSIGIWELQRDKPSRAAMPGVVELAGVRDVFTTTAQNITIARAARTTFEQEISRLETENASKQIEINSLVSSIESRKRDIQSSYENKQTIGIFGALCGYPMLSAASLIGMMNDDSRLCSLNAELSEAQRRKAYVEGEIAAYESKKKSLVSVLYELQSVESKLTRTLDSEAPALAKNRVDLALAAQDLRRREELLSNLEEQLGVLEKIRYAAQALGVNLDQTITALRQSIEKVERLADESRSELFDLITASVSKDPNKAAARLVDKHLSKSTGLLIKDLKLDVDAYVSRLIKQAFPQGGAPADALRKQLAATLKVSAGD